MTAAIAIQRTLHTEVIRGRRIELKIGLHRSPMIAVTSNRNPAYFGRTVNMAARAEYESSRRGRAVRRSRCRSVVAQVLAGLQCEVVHAALKGIGEGFKLHRLRVV